MAFILCEWGVATGVTTTWTTINLGQTFVDPIVVATALYNYTSDTGTHTIEAEIRTVTSTSFQVRMGVPPHSAVSGWNDPESISIHWFVCENTTNHDDYVLPETSLKIQAGKFASTTVDSDSSWSTDETATFYPSFTNPVVLHQRVSHDDAQWATTWCCETADRDDFPKTGASGCHVGFNRTEVGGGDFSSPETLHYIIIDSGVGTVNGVNCHVLMSGDSIQGLGSSVDGYSMGTLSGFSGIPEVAIGKQQEMDGADGSWFVTKSLSQTDWRGWSLEDVDDDTELTHTSEVCGGIVFETTGMGSSSSSLSSSSSSSLSSSSSFSLTPTPSVSAVEAGPSIRYKWLRRIPFKRKYKVDGVKAFLFEKYYNVLGIIFCWFIKMFDVVSKVVPFLVKTISKEASVIGASSSEFEIILDLAALVSKSIENTRTVHGIASTELEKLVELEGIVSFNIEEFESITGITSFNIEEFENVKGLKVKKIVEIIIDIITEGIVIDTADVIKSIAGTKQLDSKMQLNVVGTTGVCTTTDKIVRGKRDIRKIIISLLNLEFLIEGRKHEKQS